MDVHTTNYTICTYEPEFDRISRQVQVEPDYKLIKKYVDNLKKEMGKNREVICGYEAGCLGYSLYRQLTEVGIECVILAPTTMERPVSYPIKNDKRDAKGVARCLATHGYKAVYVPTPEDEAVKEYIRMRDDHSDALKRIKQQLLALCTRHGKRFTEGKNYWTQKHLTWLRWLDFGNRQLNETLSEYLATYYWLNEKLKRLDLRIEGPRRLYSAAGFFSYIKSVNCCFFPFCYHSGMPCNHSLHHCFNRIRQRNSYS